MIWFILGPYIFALLVTTRLLAGHFAYSFAKKSHQKFPRCYDEFDPDEEQWIGAFFLALFVAIVWPVVLVPYLVAIKVGAEAHAEQLQQRKRIAELEQELDLR